MTQNERTKKVISKCIKDLKSDLCLEDDIDAIAVFIVENIVNNHITLDGIIERTKQEIKDNIDLY